MIDSGMTKAKQPDLKELANNLEQLAGKVEDVVSSYFEPAKPRASPPSEGNKKIESPMDSIERSLSNATISLKLTMESFDRITNRIGSVN